MLTKKEAKNYLDCYDHFLKATNTLADSMKLVEDARKLLIEATKPYLGFDDAKIDNMINYWTTIARQAEKTNLGAQ